MKKLASFSILGLVIAMYFLHPSLVNGQSPTTSANNVSEIGNQITVNATLSIQVSNSTLDTKDKLLRSAVIGFVTSGPNVLKTTPTEQPIVRTKITNQVTKAIQSLEGIEATNAIIGVEISKAIKSLISSSNDSNQIKIVNVESSSTCKPEATKSLSCVNDIVIK
jgi:hypothetical protein